MPHYRCSRSAESRQAEVNASLKTVRACHQVWVGRLAMMGFLTSIIEEAITKKGTLGQVGFYTPSPPLFYTIVGAATAATISATAVTLTKASTGKMSAR